MSTPLEDWHAVPLKDEARISIRSFGYSRPAGQEIASLPSHCQNARGENVISTDMVEDGNVIAAALELRNAAIEALRVLEDETQPQATAREMLRAAIKKARGT